MFVSAKDFESAHQPNAFTASAEEDGGEYHIGE
jgi:hypothetical protein